MRSWSDSLTMRRSGPFAGQIIRTGGLSLAALGLGLVVLTAGAAPSAGDERRDLVNLVRQDCGSCHGLTLKGGLGRPLTAEAMQVYDEETIADIILDGLPGTAMPPWRPIMKEEDARWIASKLKQGFPE